MTTGRDRRCGWFDAVIARYATRVNGLTDFFLTKLDVLTGWERVPVCVAYEIDGKRVEEMPIRRPTSTTPSRSTRPRRLVGGHLPAETFDDLPKNAQRTSRRWRRCPGARIWASASGRAARRRSSCTTTDVLRFPRLGDGEP